MLSENEIQIGLLLLEKASRENNFKFGVAIGEMKTWHSIYGEESPAGKAAEEKAIAILKET